MMENRSATSQSLINNESSSKEGNGEYNLNNNDSISSNPQFSDNKIIPSPCKLSPFQTANYSQSLSTEKGSPSITDKNKERICTLKSNRAIDPSTDDYLKIVKDIIETATEKILLLKDKKEQALETNKNLVNEIKLIKSEIKVQDSKELSLKANLTKAENEGLSLQTDISKIETQILNASTNMENTQKAIEITTANLKKDIDDRKKIIEVVKVESDTKRKAYSESEEQYKLIGEEFNMNIQEAEKELNILKSHLDEMIIHEDERVNSFHKTSNSYTIS